MEEGHILLTNVIGQLGAYDVSFNKVDSDPTECLPDSDLRIIREQTIDAAIDKLTVAQGGGLILYHRPSFTSFRLSLHPWGGKLPTIHPESARMRYGYIGFFVDRGHVDAKGRTILPIIFSMSAHLADELHACYGYGDLDSVVESEDAAVRAYDLEHAVIPRMSAWSYYSDALVHSIGERRLHTVSATPTKTERGTVWLTTSFFGGKNAYMFLR